MHCLASPRRALVERFIKMRLSDSELAYLSAGKQCSLAFLYTSRVIAAAHYWSRATRVLANPRFWRTSPANTGRAIRTRWSQLILSEPLRILLAWGACSQLFLSNLGRRS